ncbi:hypothetical protein [Blastopirellula marina]|uniref:Uncharacterized protein n=1 Tax=Blastopirellula marina DSM 3645 TaxID=314230 RepID=A3ZWM9_9BACT|nr:hypothetical protein [Blastopirellula marina]EAQ79003.1 hypothetical protein DSM3645_13605 [Blastopirellula marina DSM 3645]
MDRTQANDRKRRFLASVCAYGLTIIVPLSLQPTSANASRWSDSAPQTAAETAAPDTTAPPLANTAPATTAAPAPKAETARDLPPAPGLRRLPPVTPESAPQSVTATTTPIRIPPADPIDWRRPAMVMGPLPGEATPHQSQVRLISDTAAVTPAPAAQQAKASPKKSPRDVAEIMPAHTTPENGATQTDPSPVEVEPAPSTPVVASRYSPATAPEVKVAAPKITPRYAVSTELANPAEAPLEPPAEKPHFARVTDESFSSPAPRDGLSPIYVCRLLGLKAATK